MPPVRLRNFILAAFALGACDSPRDTGRDPFAAALRMRRAQVFHALPPEASVTRLVRHETTSRRAIAAAPTVDTVTVPFVVLPSAGRARVEARDTVVELYAGDAAPLRATVVDANGDALSAAPAWRSLDRRIAEVHDGSVVARRAGIATLLAEWDGMSAAVSVRVRPALRLRVVDIDGTGVAEAAIVVRSGGRVDSLRTDVSGRVLLRGAIPELGSIDVRVAGPAARALGAGRITLDVATMGTDAGIVLLPSSWRLSRGRHAGIDVPIDPTAAYREGSESFARLAVDPRRGERIVGWAAHRLPLRVAAGAGVAESDVAQFWLAARDVERELGMPLFVAAAADDSSDVLLQVADGVHGAALTQASWSGSGDLMSAEVLLRGASVLRDRRVVAHELVHALGFGHTAAWHSIVAPAGRAGAAWLTPDDVAWIQLAYRLRATQERLGIEHGLDAALAARRD